MTGRPANPLDMMARDIRWAMDALRAKEPETAERILAHAWNTYVTARDESTERLAERNRNV